MTALLAAGASSARAQTDAFPTIPKELPQPRVLGSGGWSYFGDPRAVCTPFGCFAGWTTPRGRVRIARISPGDPTPFTLDADLGKPDDHNNPSLLVNPYGQLTAFWAPHSGRVLPAKSDKPSMIHYRKQRAAGTLRFGPRRAVPRPKRCRYGYTYPNPMWVRGQLLLFIRGCSWQPTVITRKNGRWTSRGRIVVQGRKGMRPYVKYDSDGKRVFMAFTECHVGSCLNNSLFFARYASGTWRRADTSPIAKMSELPFHPRDTGEPIYDGALKGGRAWVQDVAFTPTGAPVVLYTAEAPGNGSSSYWYATYVDGAWRRHRVPFGPTATDGPAGATLDHETPNVLYISRRIGLNNELSIATTADGGASWSQRQLTSTNLSSIRPVSPRNDPGFSVLWVWGDRLSYRRFNTQIRYLALPNTSAFRSSMTRVQPRGG